MQKLKCPSGKERTAILETAKERNMEDNERFKKLEELEEKSKHEIPPCDLETGDYAQIQLNRADAEKLKELLSVIIKQLK